MDVATAVGLVIAVISLIVAIIIGRCQIKQNNRMAAFEKRQDERDEKRHNDEIYAETTRFIQKYSVGGNEAEIRLLPLCIAAYEYNSVYPYRREIYREFCGLPEDVQKSILARCDIDIPCNKGNHYFSECLDKLQKGIKEYCPDDKSLFYDGGKYLERALLHHGEKDVPNVRCAIDEEQRKLLNSPLGKMSKSLNNEDMDYETHITNLLAYEADKQPISRLANEPTSLGIPVEADEILICYLCCIIAEYVPCYLNKNQEIYENTGYVCDYNGIRYMEDAFLTALHSIAIYGSYCNKGDDSNGKRI